MGLITGIIATFFKPHNPLLIGPVLLGVNQIFLFEFLPENLHLWNRLEKLLLVELIFTFQIDKILRNVFFRNTQLWYFFVF